MSANNFDISQFDPASITPEIAQTTASSIKETIHRLTTTEPLQKCDVASMISMFIKVYCPLKPLMQSDKLLLSYIRFRAISNSLVLFSKEECDVISPTLDQLAHDEPDTSVFDAFASLAAGSNLNNATPTFRIVVPLGIRLLVQAFMKSHSISKVFSFLGGLFDYSLANIMIAHSVGIDSLILDLIQDSSLDFEHFSLYAGQCLSLFNRIAVFTSSPSTVVQFLKFLHPNKENTISKLYPTYLASLFDLTEQSYDSPATFVPIGSGSFKASSSVALSKGFTLSMWIYVDSYQGSSPDRIFSFSSENDQPFEWHLIGDTISVKKGSTSVETLIKLTSRRWSLITFSFSPSRSSLNCQCSLLSQGSSSSSNIILPYADLKSSISFDFGSDSSGISGSLISTAYLFQGQFDPSAIFANGVRASAPQSALLSVSPSINEHSACFADVLSTYCSLSSLLPLFTQLDLTFEDKSEAPSFIDAVAGIFSLYIINDRSARAVFIENHLFEVLGHILCSCNPRHLTSNLYTKFYYIFETVSDNELRKALLDSVLMNNSIWIRADSQTQNKVIRDWARSIYTNFRDIAVEVRSFTDLICSLRQFFFYKPIESDYIQPHTIDPQIAEIRQGVLQAMHKLALTNFDESDFSDIIAHCISCKDPSQVCDLLSLIKLICVSEEAPYQKVKDHWDLFLTLHHLLNNSDEFIAFSVIEDFAALHFMDYMDKPKISEHVNVLMDITPMSVFSNDFFARLIPLSIKFQSFLPLCFFMVCGADIKAQKLMMKHIKPDPKFAEKKKWVIWPIVAALKNGGEFLNFTFDFIAKCTNENWDFTFSSIDAISRALHLDGDDAKTVFLNSICNNLINSKTPIGFEHMHAFFDLAIFHILFRPLGEQNEYIEELIGKSPFGTAKTEEVTNAPKGKIKDCLIENLKVTEYPTQLRFGLRIGKDGKWKDAELAINCVKEARRTKLQTFHNYAALLTAFIATENKEFASEVIDMMQTQKIADEAFMNFLISKDPRKPKPIPSSDLFERVFEMTKPYNQPIIDRSKEVASKLSHFFDKCRDSRNEIFNYSDDDLCIRAHKELVSANFNLNEKMQAAAESTMRWKSSLSMPIASLKPQVLCSNWAPFREEIADGTKQNPQTEEERKKQLEDLYGLHPPENLLDVMISRNNGDLPALDLPASLVEVDSSIPCNFVVRNSLISIEMQGYNRIKIAPNEIDHIIDRIILGKATGIEIFCHSRKSYLINLKSHSSLSVLNQISKVSGWENATIHISSNLEKSQLVEKWRSKRISNFEFLMTLNSYAGRSLHCLQSYPIFPVISGSLIIPPKDCILSPSEVASFFPGYGKFKYSKFAAESDSTLSNQMTLCVPQIYCDPHSISNLKIPGSNAFEFVYQNRKALENSDVTSKLPQWIEAVFGPSTPQESANAAETETRIEYHGQRPSALFSSSIQLVASNAKALTSPQVADLNQGIEFCFICPSNSALLSAVVGTSSGSIITVDFNQIPAIRMNQSEWKQKISKEGKFAALSQKEIVQCKGEKIEVIGMENSQDIENLHGNVKCLATSADYMVYGSADRAICVKKAGKAIFSIPIISGDMISVAASSEFDLIAVLTEQSLITISINSGLVQKVIDICGEKPIKVMITPRWGFVVVYSSQGEKNILTAFSADGELLRKTETSIKFSLLDSFSSTSDFDYIIGCSESNDIYTFEAFGLNIGEKTQHIEKKVVAIAGVSENGVGVAVSKEGTFTLFPLF